jgi:hypothetical protein
MSGGAGYIQSNAGRLKEAVMWYDDGRSPPPKQDEPEDRAAALPKGTPSASERTTSAADANRAGDAAEPTQQDESRVLKQQAPRNRLSRRKVRGPKQQALRNRHNRSKVRGPKYQTRRL